MTFLLNLEALNRKERFFLIGAALGNPTFRLSDKFRESLSESPLRLSVPSDALVFMDYHLDWIHAATFLHARGDSFKAPRHDNAARVSTGTQEDIDLVIAYEEVGLIHLILLEAKAESGWTNKQMQSKVARLTSIFGMDGRAVRGIAPHFSLVSPRPPQQLAFASWPTWMLADGKPAWMHLHVPPGRVRLEGCNDIGKPDSARPYFRFVEHPLGLVKGFEID
jgi:hypothetical protein